MTAISTNHFSAIQEERMIVGGKTSEACFERQPANGSGNEINFGSACKLVTWSACSQAPDKTDEAGKEKKEANSSSRRERPTRQHTIPKNRQGNKVGPNK